MAQLFTMDGRTMQVNRGTVTTFNEDWLNWPDAPGGKDYEPYGEDVDFAQADMLYRDAEASWYRFMVA